ncbi:MAG: Do family serine endopeptidase [Acidobacteria bacterium]|nr:MAG: Do family serine endopeptidase [Acidobacteriota bacterium]
MSTRKTTLFYTLLIAVASLAVGMVIASRMELSPESSAQTMAAPPMNSAPLSGPVDAATFRNIAQAQMPMVVNIRTESRRRTQDMTDFFGEDPFRRFFGMPDEQGQRPRDRTQVTESAGSGFIVSRDGLILTNNHVVEGATKIAVSLFGEDDEYEAKVVGRDQLTDSALIQLVEKHAKPLPEAKFGDSSQVQPGDWVMAIGNPFGYSHTVTVGVISAIGRPFLTAEQRSQAMLQTDAAINPGNSGGPLLNIRGEVVGMNTAILSTRSAEGNVGIGFAVPINVVRDLLPQLRTGKVTRGRIGVTVGPVAADAIDAHGLKERRGTLVDSVLAESPASKAGMEPGDVIIEYNGQAVRDRDHFIEMVMKTKPGTTVPVKVLRARQERTLSVTIEELDLEVENSGRRSESGGEEGGAGFGLQMGEVTPNIARQLSLPAGVTGALVVDVEPASPANRADIRRGDVILEVNREPVGSPGDASRLLGQVQSGSHVGILIWRSGQRMFRMVRKD